MTATHRASFASLHLALRALLGSVRALTHRLIAALQRIHRHTRVRATTSSRMRRPHAVTQPQGSFGDARRRARSSALDADLEEAFAPTLDAVPAHAHGSGVACAVSRATTREKPMRPDPRVHWEREIEQVRPRIVVAEDDVELRALVVSTLRRRGYEVVEARDGEELLEVVTLFFAARAPGGIDAVVSDIRMRGVTGLSALEAIRAVDPAMPVILMTAFPGEYVRHEAARLGARALLEKPFDLRQLLAIVSDVAPVRAVSVS